MRRSTYGLFEQHEGDMEGRFRYIKQVVTALGLDPGDASSSEIVQAGVFLAQCLTSAERNERVDIAGQSGYHFGWYGAPYSSSLDTDYYDLSGYVAFYNGSLENEEAEPRHSLATHARAVKEAVDVPEDISQEVWWTYLAMMAYFRVGGGWSRMSTMGELQGSVQDERLLDHVDEAERQLEAMGFTLPTEEDESETVAAE